LAGSLWEFVLDWYSDAWYSGGGGVCDNCANLASGQQRVLKGGSYEYPFASIRAANRNLKGTTAPGLTIGLRCARDVP
jgi:formylglycine-generating enzyme required for sulfatase activity